MKDTKLPQKLRAFCKTCGFTRGDLLLTAGLLLFCALTAAAPLLFAPAPREVIVRVDGVEKARLPLDRDTVYAIGSGNVIEIRDGGVRMCSADCPDQTCVRTGRITRSGQSIVCLPRRIVVTVTGGKSNDYDAQTY